MRSVSTGTGGTIPKPEISVAAPSNPRTFPVSWRHFPICYLALAAYSWSWEHPGLRTIVLGPQVMFVSFFLSILDFQVRCQGVDHRAPKRSFPRRCLKWGHIL